MSQVSIENVSIENDILTFTIKGSFEERFDKSLVNGIRRTLLNDIPTVAFNVNESNPKKDIIMTENTSSLHNEMIQERISLIPLHLDPDTFHKSYLFHCQITHENETPFQFVTANDIEIYPLNDDLQKRVSDMMDESVETSELQNKTLNDILETNDLKNYNMKNPASQKQKDLIFKPFQYQNKKNYCLLLELKNTNTDNIHQGIHFYGSPSVNTTKNHGRYQAVSCATYSFAINDEIVQATLTEKLQLDEIEPDKIDEYKKKFMINESERYYHRDKDNEPYIYDFKIKSVHYLDAENLFMKAIQILIDKLNDIKEGFILLIQEKDSPIEMTIKNDSVTIYELYDCDHTIGSIIQSHLSRNCIDDKSLLQMCGYKKTHPLEECIHLICSMNHNHKSFQQTDKIKSQQLIQHLIDEIIVIQTIYKNMLQSCRKAFQ